MKFPGSSPARRGQAPARGVFRTRSSRLAGVPSSTLDLSSPATQTQTASDEGGRVGKVTQERLRRPVSISRRIFRSPRARKHENQSHRMKRSDSLGTHTEARAPELAEGWVRVSKSLPPRRRGMATGTISLADVLRDAAPKSAVADFGTLGCRSPASPTSVRATQDEVRFKSGASPQAWSGAMSSNGQDEN